MNLSLSRSFPIAKAALAAAVIACTFALACSLIGCASGGTDSSSADAGNTSASTDGKTLRVAMELAYPPFETKDDAGNPEGLAVDFIRDFGAAYGYDVQKVWDGNPDQTFLIGTSLVRETFENETSDTGRNIISAFGSWERNLTAKDVLTLSGRGTWTTGGIQNFHNFSGQAQYLHKLDNTQSLYASVGQSFVLPTFSQMYSREQAGGISNIIGNPDLKPQKGLHYEAGWKKEETNRQYKVALFTEKIDDNSAYSGTSGRWYTINEDFKNHGIEASIRGQEDNGFTWHAGLTWQDPKSKQTTEKTSAKRYWDRSYGRILLTGGVGYEKEKWTTALNFSYLADRVQSPLAAHSHSVKPYLLTSMTVKYSPNKSSDIMLAIDNLLNRKDIVSHTTSDYYATPRNFILSYRYKF